MLWCGTAIGRGDIVRTAPGDGRSAVVGACAARHSCLARALTRGLSAALRVPLVSRLLTAWAARLRYLFIVSYWANRQLGSPTMDAILAALVALMALAAAMAAVLSTLSKAAIFALLAIAPCVYRYRKWIYVFVKTLPRDTKWVYFIVVE